MLSTCHKHGTTFELVLGGPGCANCYQEDLEQKSAESLECLTAAFKEKGPPMTAPKCEFETLLDQYRDKLESCCAADMTNSDSEEPVFNEGEIAEMHAEELKVRQALIAHVQALTAELERYKAIVRDKLKPRFHSRAATVEFWTCDCNVGVYVPKKDLKHKPDCLYIAAGGK